MKLTQYFNTFLVSWTYMTQRTNLFYFIFQIDDMGNNKKNLIGSKI